MATVTKGKTFINGELVTPEKLHQMVDAATVTNIATADISNNAITTAKIADSNVTTAKLADSAITSAKIADGTIVNADISTTAAIALSKLATGALPTAITVASANIVDGTIVNADISASAAIADSKLAQITTAGKVLPAAVQGTAVITTDSRLSDARTPTSHTHSAADITSGTLANARTTATSANTANTIVARDASGNFSAGTITASLTGNASTATTLQTARTINGVSFNGSSNITVTAAPNAHTHSAADITTGTLANARTTATSANTANTIVLRDSNRAIYVDVIDATSPGNSSGILNVLKTDSTRIGGILSNSTNTGVVYATSSDYRLKSDLEPLTGAVDRLSTLPVHRFKWIGHPASPKVDGFLAHEAQTIVPESVTGTKDAVDSNGNPIFQGIDQSKLVPLLVAAVQELAARVAALEAK